MTMMCCFEQNSDYPLSTNPFIANAHDDDNDDEEKEEEEAEKEEAAHDPPPFLPPVFDSCHRVSIVNINEKRNVIWTVARGQGLGGTMGEKEGGEEEEEEEEVRASIEENSNASFFDSDEISDEEEVSSFDEDDEELQDVVLIKEGGEEAYWLQCSFRDAIYGRIRYGYFARRRSSAAAAATAPASCLFDSSSYADAVMMDEWDVVTNQRCAVKEIERSKVKRKRKSCEEDPFKEVSALQHVLRWERQNTQNKSNEEEEETTTQIEPSSSHIVTPLDTLSDTNYLYIIMPYCDGGGLSDHLSIQQKLNEEQARSWMYQIMKVLENLQRTRICHRDISLDNLMIHKNECQLIDMGLCIRIPFATTDDVVDGDENINPKQRLLIKPQSCCGKAYYMAPEIWHGRKPFDGFAVDMWAAGIILFFLLMGFPPWEIPDDKDIRFRNMTNGILDDWWTNLGLSSTVTDLLQRMLRKDPTKRLSLEQVLAHPWMLNVSLDTPELSAENTAAQTNEAKNPFPFPPAIFDPCLRVPVVGNNANSVLTRSIYHNEHDESGSDTDDSEDESEDELSVDMGVVIVKQGCEEAYWLQESLKETIYGRVMCGLIIKQRKSKGSSIVSQALDDILRWEATDKKCVVKEMSWNKIHRLRKRLMKDPIQEVAALQYINSWTEQNSEQIISDNMLAGTHVVVPLDLLSDSCYLYCVMPFCDGARLCDHLEEKGVLKENEARYWIHQILQGLETLQRAGICHQGIGLDKLMIHGDCCVIIDMSMSLRIPYNDKGKEEVQRFLMKPQGRGSKIIYMSPEHWRNYMPFDGYTGDIWAVGMILFIMLAGFPPWHIPSMIDERFRIISTGGLARMCEVWGIEMSKEAIDLLQCMLWHDPKQRLSLEQVRSHPWMLHQDNG